MCHFDTIVIFHGCDMVLILTMYHNIYNIELFFSFPCIIDDMYISQMHILKKSKYTGTHRFVLQGFSVSFTFCFHLNIST